MTGFLLTLLLAAPPGPDVNKLVAEYFTATEARRFAIRKELKPVDVLGKKDIAKWRATLLKLARKNGPKLKKGGTNYIFGKKEAKQGKYIVGGGRGKGGLVIALHGGGKGQGDAGGAASTFGGIASKFKCVMIAPEVLEKTEKGWTTSGTEEFLLELIERAKRTWKSIPHDRIYLVGHSMGGYGSWTVGAHHVDLFAGLGPYAGAPTPITADGKPYGEVVSLELGVIPNLRNVALHVYQSLDDKNVPPAPNVFANKELIEWKKEYGGFNYKYVEVDGRGHGAPPGGHVKGFEWLYQFKRNGRPKHILWQPMLSYKRMYYWLWWNRPAPRVLVEVRVTAPNEIDVNLGGGDRDGFRVFLDDAIVDLSKEVVIKDDNEILFKGKVPYTLTSMLMTAAEKHDSGMIFPARVDLKP